MDMEYINLVPGFRTALGDGVMVGDSPKHMATWELYRAAPGSRIHLREEGYVFAPAIFSMERRPEYIYTYAYEPEENWTTYTKNLTPDSYGSEDYIFKEDCWFRLCVKREDGADLTEEDRKKAGELAQYWRDPVPYQEKPWLKEEAGAVVRRIREKEKTGMLKLCLLTDTHYTVNGIWEDTARSIETVAGEAGYEAIVHLGDLTDGMMPKEITSKYAGRIMADLKKCGVPVYITPGNHDNNYFRNRPNTFSAEEMRELYHLYGDEDDRDGAENLPETGGDISYYIDKPEYSVRMIFLSSFDDRAPVRYGYTDSQLIWLEKVLGSAPKGTRFLVFSHDAPLGKLDFWSFTVRNGEKLLKILEECNSREEYQIAGLFYGHTHGDYVFEGCSFPVLSVGCSKLEYMLEKKPEGCVTPPREPDTRTQELWDSLLVDFEEERLRLVRFGAGEDREISFKKKRETYTERTAALRARRRPKIWAHRGESGHAPENTLPAFELAWDMGADGIELDVQMSKNGALVVIHDETVDRVSDGTGWVKDLTLEELRALNVNKLFPRYGRVGIPTLEEVLDFIKTTDMTVNVELKNHVVSYKGLEEKVIGLVREKGLEERVICSSFNHYSVRKIQRLAPEVKTGFLYSDGILDAAEYGGKYGVYALHPPVRQLRMGIEGNGDAEGRAWELVRQCRERDMKVHVWGVNEEEDFERMRDLGVDAVITDFVERGGEI